MDLRARLVVADRRAARRRRPVCRVRRCADPRSRAAGHRCGRFRLHARAGIRDRAVRVVVRLARVGLARTRDGPVRDGARRGARSHGVRDAVLAGACRPRLFQGRRLRRGERDRRHGAGRRVHVLPGGPDSRLRGAGPRRILRAFRAPRPPVRREDLGPRLHRGEHALRGRVEHAAARRALRDGLHGARPCVRADRHPDRLRPQEGPARPHRAADHHAAVRDRAGAHPDLRPLRPRQQRARARVRAGSPGAGSTECRACCSRRSSRSRRSRFSC